MVLVCDGQPREGVSASFNPGVRDPRVNINIHVLDNEELFFMNNTGRTFVIVSFKIYCLVILGYHTDHC
jgi:hypothetical protein